MGLGADRWRWRFSGLRGSLQDYKDNHDAEYYAIVPLFDMNRKTGATAIVPGSHAKVDEINALRKQIGGIAVRSLSLDGSTVPLSLRTGSEREVI